MTSPAWNAHRQTLRSGPLRGEAERALYTDAVDDALTNPKVAKKVDKRLSASASNVRRAAAHPSQVSTVLSGCGAVLSSYRAAVQRRETADGRLREATGRPLRDWRLIGAVIACGWFSLYTLIGSSTAVLWALAGCALISLALAVMSSGSRACADNWLALARRWAESRWARAVMESRARAVTLRMRNATLPMVVDIVEDLLGDDQDSLYLPTSKQGLYSARSRAYVVDSAASAQLKRKIDQIDDGTIAVCGPRGTGKTTLLEEATADAAFSVLVQVPATYTPHDFLLHLSAKVCEDYIGGHGYPVPEFTSLGLIRRPLRFARKATSRLARRLVFAAVSAGLLVLGLAREVDVHVTEHGPGLREQITGHGSRLFDYGEQIWRGERPVAALALTVAGIFLWSCRTSPGFRRTAARTTRIALRFAALAVIGASVFSLFYDRDIRHNSVQLYEGADWGVLLAVFVALPYLIRIIWRRHRDFYVERAGRYSEPQDARALLWLGTLVVCGAVGLHWAVTQEEIVSLVFDDDNAARVALVCTGLGLFDLTYRRNRRRTPYLVHRCQRHLYRLRTLQNATAMVSLGMPDKLGASQTTSLSLAPLTYPELVSDFRQILGDIALECGSGLGPLGSYRRRTKVIIAIDELDRVGTEEQALAFLREVKAVFGIRGVCYLISVAEDVGAAFVRRGLPHRDVTESSLDDVLHVRPCTLAESTAILKERVPGLTPPYACLSHALSGGVPRDLIRYGRRLDEVQQETNAYEMAQLAWEMISDEVAEALASTRVLLADEPGWTAGTAAVLLHLGELEQLLSADGAEQPGSTLSRRNNARVLMTDFAGRRVRPMRQWTVDGAQPWPTGPGLSDGTLALLEEASAYVYFGLTLLDVFGSAEFTRRKAAADGRSPRRDGVQPLAEARQELSISPQSARVIISDVRAAWGLAAL
ncbi:hypothetical protein ACH4D5_01125 [Streptomyces sp. NPDC018029]|uniref:hypothetical protein n=1 Tax=Streptomyces sp. NPDC018029 TaxID=3365032 RepID=UPI0037B46210